MNDDSIHISSHLLDELIADIDNTKEIKDELEERLKGELATRDFVRAEIAEAKQELKQEIVEANNKFNILEQKMKFYAIGLGVLMIVLQPKVFEFIVTLFK